MQARGSLTPEEFSVALSVFHRSEREFFTDNLLGRAHPGPGPHTGFFQTERCSQSGGIRGGVVESGRTGWLLSHGPHCVPVQGYLAHKKHPPPYDHHRSLGLKGYHRVLGGCAFLSVR